MEETDQQKPIEMTNVAFQGDDEDELNKEPENEEKKVPEKKEELTAEEAEELKKLFEAAIKEDLPLLRELHSKGAKLDVVNKDGNPLLHFPVRASNPAMVAFMVENKVDVNAVNRNGTDALQLASYAGDNEILEILVYAGANINHQDTSGNTALHFACQFNHLICSMQLINFGSRLDLINSIGDVPLHGACRNSMLDVVTRMCVLGCPVNTSNNQKETPLHISAKAGNSEVVRVLMLHGAKINTQDKNFKIPEELATKSEVKKLFTMYKQVVQGSSANKKHELRKSLNPSPEPLNQLKVMFLGSSGVGKTAVIESLKCGFLKSFLWSSYYTFSKSGKATKDIASKLSDPMGTMNLGNGSFTNPNYTKGISVQKTNINDIGDVVLMDFSGVETYYNSYSLFLGDSSCAHVIVVSLNDPPHVRQNQIDFWLEFIRSRMSPKEPIGFSGCNMWAPNIYIIATNPREDNCEKNDKGFWVAGQEWAFINKLLEKYEREVIINQPIIILDALLPNSQEMTLFKQKLNQQKELIERFLPTRLGCLGDILFEFQGLVNSKSTFPVVWFHEFASWVREKVNILALDDNIREVLVQLQLMGEVICFGTEPSELIVLRPNWLGTEVIGTLFSREALQTSSKWSGFVEQSFIEGLTPKIEFSKLIELLKVLGLTFERNVNNSKEYYLHPYNKMDFKSNAEEVFKASQNSALKAVVHIETPISNFRQLTYLFPSVVIAINMSFKSQASDFKQWKNACSAQYSGNTGIVELENENDNARLVLKCFSINTSSDNLFTFCESICAVVFGAIDAVAPGLFFQRLPTSWSETQMSLNLSVSLKSEDILHEILKSTKNSEMVIKVGDREEKLCDILTFGSQELFQKITLGTDAPVSCLSHFARGLLAWHIDKNTEKCLKLIKALEVDENVIQVQDTSISIFDRLISYWSSDPEMTIKKLATAIEDCYGADLFKLLLKLTPVFVYASVVQTAPEE